MLLRMRRLLILWLVCLAVSPALTALAETCATLPDRSAERTALFARLAAAPTEAAGRAAEEAIWRFWSTAPDARAQELLDRIHDRRRWHDHAAALAAAEALTAYCPAYAEGWNQKATVLFVMERPEAALAAADEALAREPKHFGALAGKALILMAAGRAQAGDRALARAVAIHPWLRERGLLAVPPGTDL